MKFFNSILVLVLLATPATASLPNMDVVLRAGDKVEETDWANFPKFRDGKCTIRYPRDGNWATQNGFFTGGWDANQNSKCDSYNGPKMTYKLQGDGNFVAYCGYELDYSTHTGQGRGGGDYFMAIDDECILHLYKGTFDCDSVSIEEELWTNIRKKPLERGDRLGKGEMVRVGDGTNLVMQSVDGNLVLYRGTETALWGANQEWNGPPPGNLHGYYAKITKNGRLLLVGRDYQDGSETVYFRKVLKNYDGGDCFTVEYDADEDDLVAVPCDGSRLRKLRGA